MEEGKKKKRWRPSLAAYRELEEVIHRQCVELRGWREQYHALEEKMDKSFLEMKLENSMLSERAEKSDAKIADLMGRGFWARLLNK